MDVRNVLLGAASLLLVLSGSSLGPWPLAMAGAAGLFATLFVAPRRRGLPQDPAVESGPVPVHDHLALVMHERLRLEEPVPERCDPAPIDERTPDICAAPGSAGGGGD